MNTIKYAFLLLLFFVFQKTLLAENSSPFEAYANCESEGEQNCDDLFKEAIDYAMAAKSDTASARLLIELAQIRKDMGVWDEEVKKLFFRAEELYEKAGWICGRALARRARAAFLQTSEEGDLGMQLTKEALELAKQCGDKEILAFCYASMGLAYQDAGEYAAAIEAHTEELRLYQELGNREMVAISNQEMAYIYASMDDLDGANKIMLESAKIFKEMGLDLRYANCITDLCANYLDQNRPDSVIKRLPEAIEYYRESEYALGVAIAVYNLGEAYMLKEDYQKALELYEESSVVCADIDFPRFLMEIEISRSQCYTGMGDHEKAYEHILKAEQFAEETSDYEGLLNIFQFKMSAAHEVEKYDASHKAALDYIQLKDSLRSISRDEKVAAMQEELDAEKREREIEKLAQEAELEKQKKNGLIILVMVVLVAAILIINREIQRRKKAKLLHQKEIELQKEHEQRLQEELSFKKRELASQALQIAQKNEVLESLREEVKNISLDAEADKSVKEVLNTLKIEKSIDSNWDEFTRQFQEINPAFYQRLNSKADGITKNDLRLAALLKMNLSSKEIASTLNITTDGVKKARHRFRKKLNLSAEASLETFIVNL
ncbi:hypothetical protein O3Q51_14910 [Cryomorphaceae bacterium 1068]|nr:hypothetical protein [Cryomorphaceae bacterium 1068]